MRFAQYRFIAVAVSFIGCSSSSAPRSNQVSVNGTSVSVSQAASVFESRTRLRIVLTDHAGVCEEVAAGQGRAGAAYTGVVLSSDDGIVPGTYGVNTVNQPKSAAVFTVLPQGCEVAADAEKNGITGNVIVEEVSASERVSGTFDVQLVSGERLTGEFNAPTCATAGEVSPDGGACSAAVAGP